MPARCAPGATPQPPLLRGYARSRRPRAAGRALASVRGALLPALLAGAVWAVGPTDAAADTRNGFDLADAAVPSEEIRPGGPPRDGILALDDPPSMAAAGSVWPGEEMVIGVAQNGEARAYPLRVLWWHELVNDVLGGRPILVSYSPLSGSAIVFDRGTPAGELRFGVSGLLYQSAPLIFDRESESLWAPIPATAVTGPRRGTRLQVLPARVLRLDAWLALHPRSSILRPNTGRYRLYQRDPYAGYPDSDALYYPVRDLDARYPPKTPTLGLRSAGGASRAYPAPELEAVGLAVEESFAGGSVAIHYDPTTRSFEARVPDGVEAIPLYWFAWPAFHRDTSVFRAP